MAEIVNLNKARKARAKAERDREASQNRLRFGRTRAERKLEAAKTDLASRRLDDHKRD